MKLEVIEIIESKEVRDNILSNNKSLELMDEYKPIVSICDTQYSTMKQVADYFQISYDCIKKCVLRNKDELINNGLCILSGKNTKELLGDIESPKKYQGGFEIDGNKFANKSNTLINRRCFLNIAMLLEGSEIARDIRKAMLNIVEDKMDNINQENKSDNQDVEKLIDMLNKAFNQVQTLVEQNNKLTTFILNNKLDIENTTQESEIKSDKTKSNTKSDKENNTARIKNANEDIKYNHTTNKSTILNSSKSNQDKIREDILTMEDENMTINNFLLYINEKTKYEKHIGIQTFNKLMRDNDIFIQNNSLKNIDDDLFKFRKVFSRQEKLITKKGMLKAYDIIVNQFSNNYQAR